MECRIGFQNCDLLSLLVVLCVSVVMEAFQTTPN